MYEIVFDYYLRDHPLKYNGQTLFIDSNIGCWKQAALHFSGIQDGRVSYLVVIVTSGTHKDYIDHTLITILLRVPVMDAIWLAI